MQHPLLWRKAEAKKVKQVKQMFRVMILYPIILSSINYKQNYLKRESRIETKRKNDPCSKSYIHQEMIIQGLIWNVAIENSVAFTYVD